MTDFLKNLWEGVVRLRTWLFNMGGILLIALPDILGAPEVLAIIPPGQQKYLIAAVFLINLWMRPRPAAMAKDKK